MASREIVQRRRCLESLTAAGAPLYGPGVMKCIQIKRTPRAGNGTGRRARIPKDDLAFTLTELLVVTLLIAVLAGLVVGLAGYVQTRSARSRAQAQMAVIEAACEAFHADVGRYPTSTPGRVVVGTDIAAVENNHLLFQQLMGGGYVSAASFDVKPTPVSDTWIRPVCDPAVWGGWVITNRYELILDPWGRPYRYYCRYPRPTGVASTETVSGSCDYTYSTNTYTGTYTHTREIGPQVNLTFDLWSSGPNRKNEQGRGDDLANFQW